VLTPPAPNYLDLRADNRAIPTPPSHEQSREARPSPDLAPTPRRPIPRGIMTDDSYRRDTIRSLLLSAAKADPR
jgi:hypothetical protein